jgi:hypothetical protein
VKNLAVSPRRRGKSRLNKPHVGQYLKASAMAGVAAAPVSVLANFSGDYAVTPPPPGSYSNAAATGTFGNWNASLPGMGLVGSTTLDTTGAPNQISLSTFSNNGPDHDYKFLTTAAATGLVSFDFTAVLNNNNASASFVDETTMTSSPLTGSGLFSIPVASGDMFGFELTASYVNGHSGSAALTISNFSAPEPSTGVPDNGSALALLAFGFVGLLAFRMKIRPAS